MAKANKVQVQKGKIVSKSGPPARDDLPKKLAEAKANAIRLRKGQTITLKKGK